MNAAQNPLSELLGRQNYLSFDWSTNHIWDFWFSQGMMQFPQKRSYDHPGMFGNSLMESLGSEDGFERIHNLLHQRLG